MMSTPIFYMVVILVLVQLSQFSTSFMYLRNPIDLVHRSSTGAERDFLYCWWLMRMRLIRIWEISAATLIIAYRPG